MLVFILAFVLGALLGNLTYCKYLRSLCKKIGRQYEKQKDFYSILLRWVQVHQEGRSLVEYFKKNNVKNIAIYGMRELGVALIEELKNSEISVCYGIDKDAANIFVGVDVFSPDEELREVDMVVVTAIQSFGVIEEIVNNKLKCRVVSIEDVVYGA